METTPLIWVGDMVNTVIMFLRRNKKKKGGVDYECWTLVESVRTTRGPRQRIVATIGKLPGLTGRSGSVGMKLAVSCPANPG